MRPILVNIAGEPSAGKTTTALELTARLKRSGIHAVYVPEYATDLVYRGELTADSPQTIQDRILLQQTERCLAVFGQADVVVTDSPVWMQVGYCTDKLRQEKVRAMVTALEYLYECVDVVLTNEALSGEKRGRIENHPALTRVRAYLDTVADYSIVLTKNEAVRRLDDIIREKLKGNTIDDRY